MSLIGAISPSGDARVMPAGDPNETSTVHRSIRVNDLCRRRGANSRADGDRKDALAVPMLNTAATIDKQILAPYFASQCSNFPNHQSIGACHPVRRTPTSTLALLNRQYAETTSDTWLPKQE
jgi:hypothetical protein